MTTDERQPMLFADLPIPPALPEAPPRGIRRRVAPRLRRRAQQLCLDFDAREFAAARGVVVDDDDTAFDFPQHRRSVAGHEPPPPTTAASSVWAMAAAAPLKPRRAARQASSDAPAAPAYRVERDAGRVRVVRLRPEETEEWIERERQRRAKQRPPRPTKGAKTRGKKVRAWDGEAVEE